MRARFLLVSILASNLAAPTLGCVTPADVAEADREKCSGFGFEPGTPDHAKCMMRLSQQRDAQDAERQLQQEHDRSVNEQIEKDRQAEQEARDKAAADQRYKDWLEMSGHGSSPPPPTPRDSSSSDDDTVLPSGVAISGMNCSGEGDDMACDAR